MGEKKWSHGEAHPWWATQKRTGVPQAQAFPEKQGVQAPQFSPQPWCSETWRQAPLASFKNCGPYRRAVGNRDTAFKEHTHRCAHSQFPVKLSSLNQFTTDSQSCIQALSIITEIQLNNTCANNTSYAQFLFNTYTSLIIWS